MKTWRTLNPLLSPTLKQSGHERETNKNTLPEKDKEEILFSGNT